MTIIDKKRFFSTKTKYTKLLIVLIILFFIYPLISILAKGYLFISLVFLLVNLLVIETLSLKRKWIYLLRAIAIISWISEVIFFQELPIFQDFLYFLDFEANLSYMLFNGLAILAIGKRIFIEKQVNRDIVHGGICVFLILGLLWSNFYQLILSIDSHAFQNVSLEEGDQIYQMLYYSFTTITTLGYGDITPVNKFAMTFANAEAIIGLLYPSIFIARLVALYTTQEQADN